MTDGGGRRRWDQAAGSRITVTVMAVPGLDPGIVPAIHAAPRQGSPSDFCKFWQTWRLDCQGTSSFVKEFLDGVSCDIKGLRGLERKFGACGVAVKAGRRCEGRGMRARGEGHVRRLA